MVWPTPAPTNVIPRDMFRVLVQVALPAGTCTISPGAAAVTAARTSIREALWAIIVAAPAGSGLRHVAATAPAINPARILSQRIRTIRRIVSPFTGNVGPTEQGPYRLVMIALSISVRKPLDVNPRPRKRRRFHIVTPVYSNFRIIP